MEFHLHGYGNISANFVHYYFPLNVHFNITIYNAYIPVNASSYRVNEELYSYNKDSDQWFCIAGNETYKKKRGTVQKRGKKYEILKYYFEKEKCRDCPHRDECIGKRKSVW